jgi:hypothetical protein
MNVKSDEKLGDVRRHYEELLLELKDAEKVQVLLDDFLEAKDALTAIVEHAEHAIAVAERGGDVHAIHAEEYKALNSIWHFARTVIGFKDDEDGEYTD